MGCDGGTIPTRDELVKTKKRPEQVMNHQINVKTSNTLSFFSFSTFQKDPDSVRIYKWAHCALTQEPLEKPVVACELGRIFNKEAIIEKLLNTKSEGTSDDSLVADHIKSLKDVKELELEPNPAFKGDKASVGDGGYIDKSRAQWICPLTAQEMNGRFPFVFDWSSGKVMSLKAQKMLKEDKVSAIAEENLIILNPEFNGEEENLMRAKMEARRARVKAAKKAAKEHKRKMKSDTAESQDSETVAKKVKSNGTISADKNSGAKASTSQKNGKTKSSVQQDPTKSEVYKSLFSSHHTALNKPKGNWVTFDPRYN